MTICHREGCTGTGINAGQYYGYCSFECRDSDEYETEINELKKDIERYVDISTKQATEITELREIVKECKKYVSAATNCNDFGEIDYESACELITRINKASVEE